MKRGPKRIHLKFFYINIIHILRVIVESGKINYFKWKENDFKGNIIYYTTFLSDLLRSQISNNSYYCHPFRVIIMIIVRTR